ncbi:transposase [Nonomuraea sp. NPDC004186]
MRGKWHGTTGLPAGVPVQGAGPTRAGRTATELARDLDISTQTIYTWRRQDRIDRGCGQGTYSARGRGEPELGSPAYPW